MKVPFSIYIALLSLIICSSCEKTDVENEQTNNSPTLNLDTRSVSPQLMANTQLFLFDGDNSKGADGQFYKKIVGVTRTADKLSMNIETGKWNIGLVTCEDNPLTQLIPPVRGSAPEDLLMWETVPVAGALPDTPEILTDVIKGIDIVANTDQTASTSLGRHVAMVQVLLKDGVGFKTGGGHYVYLKNVPTSLSWGGSLFPNKTNPDHSGEIRMTKELTFSDAGSGRQKSDAVNFIIPAHKSANVADTTTHKLKLGVIFKTVGGTTFEKHDVVIDDAPKDNKILRINITAKGGVEVKSEIVDWTLENSSVSPKMYEMVASGYNAGSQEWTYTLTMHQERNWWVKLGGSHPEYFEFVDATAATGQVGTSTIRIRRSSLHPGGSQTATLSLYVSGYSQIVESWTIQD